MDEYWNIFLFIIILAIITYFITKTGLLTNSSINSSTNSSILKMSRQQTSSQSHVEGFLDYQDVKTKTLNWCNKMQKTGLLTANQFDQCVSTFKDTTAGLVSSGITDSKYGMNMDYSLYNTRAKKLSGSITNSNGGDNTNTIMIMTPHPDNKTLACKPDGSLYQVSNTDDPKINQKELYFTLVPINETAFSILSPYGAFLTTDNTYNAGFTGKSIGPLSTWNIVKMTSATSSSNSNLSKIMIESTQYTGFHLIFDSLQNTLSIQQGQNDTMMWSISARASDDNTPDSKLAMNVSQYIVLKEDILVRYRNNAIIRVALQAGIDTINKLQSQVSNNYSDITNYVQNYLQQQERLYQLSSSDYNTRLESIQNNSMIDTNTQTTLINSLPKIQGIDVNSDTVNQVLTAINNQKNITLQYINNNALLPLQQQLSALDISDTSIIDYNKFIADLNSTLQDTNNQIEQNQKIITRQKDKYNDLNADFSYQQNKINELDNIDKVAELNVGLLSTYQSQKSYITKIYPVCIFFLVIGLIYLSYITYKKFIDNVLSQYKD
jgi:hypothetical protein